MGRFFSYGDAEKGRQQEVALAIRVEPPVMEIPDQVWNDEVGEAKQRGGAEW
ncbi:hypothetical protein GP5015_1863 [gamma proteobacterium HTCC5015]|nr:hypothetical protein GP5015_1863 [gamma proteobacterium HTCC5015]